jgi:nucleoside-diphosphate-sugar epimerase
MKRILITGASGFIGGYLVDEALRRGYEVWAGVRSSSSLAGLQGKGVKLIDLQYADVQALTAQLREIADTVGAWHYVIHNAGLTKTLNVSDFERVNHQYTATLTESLAAADCKPEKFVLMSSLSSYGPVREHSDEPIRESDPQRPDSLYGRSKQLAEQVVSSQTHFPYVILRPTGVYGPGEKDYLVEIKSVMSGFDFKVGMKPQRLTFIYVRDLATVALTALEKEEANGRAFFVADGDVHTDSGFAKMIKEIVGKRFLISVRIPLCIGYLACVLSEFTGRITHKAPTLNTDKYRILRQRNWLCDVEPLREILGFKPAYNLKKGLEETIKKLPKEKMQKK